MTYYPDLSPYCYPAREPRPPSIWDESYVGPPETPVLNVGLLAGQKPYAKGPTSTAFQERLQRLCAPDHWVEMTLGYHQCPFCDAYPARERIGGKLVSLGCAEIRVRGPAAEYAAPNLIYHYVMAHEYLPPEEFIAAVLGHATK